MLNRMGYWQRELGRLALLILSIGELIVLLPSLPRVIETILKFDALATMIILIGLVSFGSLTLGLYRMLTSRPAGWIWLILGNILWFSWLGLTLDAAQTAIKWFVF